MKHTDRVARRLALREGVSLSPADLEAIVAEFEDFERALAELEPFSQGVPWLAVQVQPPEKGINHGSL